jgi:hypothetical protein
MPTTPSTAARPQTRAVPRPAAVPKTGEPQQSTNPPVVNGPHYGPVGTASSDWATRMHVPPGWTLVTQGKTETVDWRVYAQQQKDGSACYGMFMETAKGGGGTTSCGKPPLKVSGVDSPARLLFGVVAFNAATVVVEHAGAPAETFPAIAPGGFSVRLFGGAVGPTPLTRIVAYDRDGKKVAEKSDVQNLNGG